MSLVNVLRLCQMVTFQLGASLRLECFGLPVALTDPGLPLAPFGPDCAESSLSFP